MFKKAITTALIIGTTLFGNPGMKINTYGNAGFTFDKNSGDLQEMLSLDSHANVGIAGKLDEFSNIVIVDANYTNSDNFKGSIDYNLYENFNDTTEIQGMQLNYDKIKERIQNQGYGIKTKYLNLNYEFVNKHNQIKRKFADISWVRSEQENNEELQNIWDSIYEGGDWNLALFEFIIAATTNSLEASLGDFEKITENHTIDTRTEEKHYSLAVNIPHFNVQSGIRISEINSKIFIDNIFKDKIEYENYNWFSNVSANKKIKQTNNSIVLGQDVNWDSKGNVNYDWNGRVKMFTSYPQRHYYNVEFVYNQIYDQFYPNATYASFSINFPKYGKKFCKNELNKFKEGNNIRYSPYVNKVLKYALLEDNNMNKIAGNSLGVDMIYDDGYKFVIKMASGGDESGMAVDYYLNKKLIGVTGRFKDGYGKIISNGKKWNLLLGVNSYF